MKNGSKLLDQEWFYGKSDPFLTGPRVPHFWPIPRGTGQNLFPECVARVPVSLRGSGGWGCVRSTLRLRPQPFEPFAWGPYGRAYSKFCNRGHFWRFPASRCFVSCGRRGTSWHSDLFRSMSKAVLCGRRNTFAILFSEDALLFSWQALWTSHDKCIVILRGRRSTLEESCCVVFANRIVRAASSGDKGCVQRWQRANSVAGMAFCEMCWKLTKASHETSTEYTPHSTLYTLHSTLDTLHFTLRTLQFTLYTPHSTLCTPPSSAFNSLQCTGMYGSREKM